MGFSLQPSWFVVLWSCTGLLWQRVPPPGRVGLWSLQICAAAGPGRSSCCRPTGLEGLVWRKREGAFLEFVSQDLQCFCFIFVLSIKCVLFYCRNSLWWQI